MKLIKNSGNDRVLVLCPKRLRDNWTVYKANDRRNFLAADRFNYDVLNHTDLSRPGGSLPFRLRRMRFANRQGATAPGGVQSAQFLAEHKKNPAAEFSISGVEKTDETGRLCRMNLAEGKDERN